MRRPTPVFVLALALTACNGGGTTSTTTAETGDPTDTAATDPATDTTPTGDASGDPLLCGNGELDPGESCDGAALDGKQCVDVDPTRPGGTLACSATCSFDVSGCEAGPGTALVALNEVSAKGATEGPYAGKGDAIELINAGLNDADITGWKLSDDPAFPVDKTYVFPAGSKLAPGAYLVLVTLDPDTSEGEFPFGISTSKEETLTLADAGGVTIDQLIVQGADATVSYCRLPDGAGAWQTCDLTLGGANMTASSTCGDGTIEAAETCDGAELGGATCQTLGFTAGALACSATCTLDASMCESDSSVVINELESTTDQIELYNAGPGEVDISGWILTDDQVDANYDPDLDLEKLVFPPGTTLAADAFLVSPPGDLPGQHPFGLAGSGDTVTLLDADLALVGQVSYGNDQASTSYCRVPDGPGGAWMADCTPTPGAANNP